MAKNSNTNVVTVDAGTKEIRLRIKTLLLYHHSVVSPLGAWDWYGYNDMRVVRDDNFPADYAPNFFTSDCGRETYTGVNCPALTGNYHQVTRAWVDSNSSGAYVKSVDTSVKDGGISRTTRYHFTPDSDLVIRAENGFNAEQDIHVRIAYKRTRRYYTQSWQVCDSGGSGAQVGSPSQCPENQADAWIKVKVRAPIMEGHVAVDDPTHGDSVHVWKDQNNAGGSQTTKNRQTVGSDNRVEDKTIRRVRPGNKLCWWYQMNNKGPGATLDQFDMMNFRRGSSNAGWNIESFDGNNLTPNNYFTMRINAYSNSGQWGCFNWGTQAAFKSGSSNSLTSISMADATKRNFAYTVRSDDVTRTICQRMRWSWNEGNGWNERSTPNACAYVPYHYPSCDPSKSNCDTGPPKDCIWNGTCPDSNVSRYGVIPSTSHSGSGTVMMGDSVQFKYTVNNGTSYTKTKPMSYRAYAFVLKGGQNVASASGAHSFTTNRSSGSYQDTDICKSGHTQRVRGINTSTHLRSGIPCSVTASGSGLQLAAGGSWNSGNKTITLDAKYANLQPGDQICSYVVVDKWNVIDDVEAPSVVASNIDCVKVGKRPQIQINGGDSYAKQGFFGASYTASSLAGNNNRGSYSQYSLLTGSGAISNFGSSAHTTLQNNQLACRLAYRNVNGANENCSKPLGAAGLAKTLSVPSQSAAAKRITSNVVSLSSLGSGEYYYDGAGELKISGNLVANRQVTIYAKSGIRITGNIDYDRSASHSHLVNIPIVNLVATSGNIVVDSGVGVITANLIATNGRLITCADSTDADLGVIDKCAKQLNIYGGVVTKSGLELRRAFGGGNVNQVNQSVDANITTTSERFNYSPDQWLSSVRFSGQPANSFTTTSLSTLPVRY